VVLKWLPKELGNFIEQFHPNETNPDRIIEELNSHVAARNPHINKLFKQVQKSNPVKSIEADIDPGEVADNLANAVSRDCLLCGKPGHFFRDCEWLQKS